MVAQGMRTRRNSPEASRVRAAAVTLAATLLASAVALAEPVTLTVQQGTDLSFTMDRDGQIVAYLAGRLWRIPAGGGTAVALTPPGQFASRPALSPDGRTLAYQTLRDGRFQIALADADGANPREVTSGPWNHLAPAWAPDGRRLAIASDRSGDFAIWELDVAALTLTQLSFDPGHELDPAWEPSGQALAWIGQRGNASALVLHRPGRPARTLIANGTRLHAPSWRPDGTVITVVSETPQGPRLQMVILSDPPVLKPLAQAESASPAPTLWRDRNHLIYAADGRIRLREFGASIASDIPFQADIPINATDGAPARVLPEPGRLPVTRSVAGFTVLPDGHLVVSALGDLSEIDVDGQLLRNLTQDAFVDRDPDASSDGRWLAFTSDRVGSPQIWVMDLSLGTVGQVTNEPGFAARATWDSRAQRLAYLAGGEPGDRDMRLMVLSPDSGAVTTLASGLWRPGAPAWSPDDTQVAVVQSVGGRPQLLLFAADGSSRRRLTLPLEAAGPGGTEIRWSRDGKSLLLASAAGVRRLPVLDDGQISVEWERVTDEAARTVRLTAEPDIVLFSGEDGLASTRSGAPPTPVPLALSESSPPAPARMIIRASRVFDGTGENYLYNHEIVVDAARIVAVRPWAGATAESEGLLIDARGKTVVPGLIDLAVGLSDASGERLGRTLLAYGVTTVQAFAEGTGDLRDLAARWQARRSGPRLLLARDWCGAQRQPDAPPAAGLAEGALRLCPTAVDEAAQIAAAGLAGSLPVWSEAWLAAGSGRIAAIGPLAGTALPVTQGLIAGGGPYHQDAVDMLVHSRVTVIPALARDALPLLLEAQPDLVSSPQYLQLLRPGAGRGDVLTPASPGAADVTALRNRLRDRQRLASRIAAGGGRLAVASGAPASPYGLGLHAELRLLVDAGLKPAQVLRMAMAEPARALGLQGEIGTLAAGRRADLLVVDGDPLSRISDLLKADAVVVDGHLHRSSALLSPPAKALENFTAAGPVRPSKAPSGRRRK
jgi:Tol biopolymer transport system component